jgi:hypothetical protein
VKLSCFVKLIQGKWLGIVKKMFNLFFRSKKMKLKWLSTIVLLIVLISSNGFSSTIARWAGAPAGDANQAAGTGSWKAAYWSPGPSIPPAPAGFEDEIKITGPNTVCTVDSDTGNYVCKMSISGGSDMGNMPKLEIVKGGNLGIGEFRVGAGGSAKTGTMGCVNQTGGTLSLAKDLLIGRASTSQNNPNDGKGFYTISGGTIECTADNSSGGLYVGGNGTGDAPSEGTFTVAGSEGKIKVKKLCVGNDGKKKQGSGKLEFKIDAKGVSPIQTGNIYLDLSGATITTKLIVIAIAGPPKADILLVDNQGSGPVSGAFDTVNDKSAGEGADVVLSFDGVDYNYSLTYKGGASGNSIMLKFKTSGPGAAAAAKP